jgi:uncharacterized protein YjbI with pentapeptide repeats
MPGATGLFFQPFNFLAMTAEELLAAYAAGERDFSRADLHGVDLSGAELSGANLPPEADLTNAIILR